MKNSNEFSDSDSEDDAEMRKFVEAADTTLLTNELYQQQTAKPEENIEKLSTKSAPVLAKSMRYLDDNNVDGNHAGDLEFSNEIQAHFQRKLSTLISQRIEFVPAPVVALKHKFKPARNKVRLLSDSDCFIKTLEEDQEAYARPQKKPNICRRLLPEQIESREVPNLQELAVSGDEIYSGSDMKYWAERPIRPEKVFYYKSDAKGVLRAQEIPTMHQRKRRWDDARVCTNLPLK